MGHRWKLKILLRSMAIVISPIMYMKAKFSFHKLGGGNSMDTDIMGSCGNCASWSLKVVLCIDIKYGKSHFAENEIHPCLL